MIQDRSSWSLQIIEYSYSFYLSFFLFFFFLIDFYIENFQLILLNVISIVLSDVDFVVSCALVRIRLACFFSR